MTPTPKQSGGACYHIHEYTSTHCDQTFRELVARPCPTQWSVNRCAVCDDDRDFDFDQLETCEGCAISVHQSCYGGGGY